MLEQPVRARIDRNGRQVVEVSVHGGYHPGAIVARAGLPLRLVFRRDDDDTCSERVVFSAPRLDRRLAPTGTTTIDLPAQPPGEIRFTCGMGRYRGHIGLVEERAPSIVARLRDEASRLETALGTALVLWICSLPLIARGGRKPRFAIGQPGTIGRCCPSSTSSSGPSPVSSSALANVTETTD